MFEAGGWKFWKRLITSILYISKNSNKINIILTHNPKLGVIIEFKN